MTWFPGWAWFVTPSGGPTPGWPAWLDVNKRRPILAHPLGALVVAWGFSWFWPITAGIAAAMLAEATNQFHKATRGVYGRWLWREVGWRMGLALVGALMALLLP